MTCTCFVCPSWARTNARLCAKLQKRVAEWIMDLIADTALSQASVYANAHYVTIVKQQDLVVVESSFISAFIREQPERSFQHIRMRLREDDKLKSVINCHAPSSGKRLLTNERRLGHFREFHKVSGEDHSILRRRLQHWILTSST